MLVTWLCDHQSCQTIDANNFNVCDCGDAFRFFHGNNDAINFMYILKKYTNWH